MTDLEGLAADIAEKAHLGQLDKVGQPYIRHPRRVAERVRHLGDEAVAAALLHDVIEDTGVTLTEMQRLGVPNEVLVVLHLLTRGADVPDSVYYACIRLDATALAVKLADIADNTDPRRLDMLDDAVRARLERKYARALVALGGEERSVGMDSNHRPSGLQPPALPG